MSASLLGGLIAVAVVIALALMLRRGSTDAPATPRAAEDALSEGAVPDPDDDELVHDDDDDEVVAVTSDGFALVPDAHAIRLMPPAEEGEQWKPGRAASHARGERALAMSWHAGDFSGGRVVRGDADEGPWRFEAMGRDGEYTAFVFETREGADAALAAFESRGVIRLGRDEDGNAVPPSPEQFAEARRVFLATEAELDFEDEEGR